MMEESNSASLESLVVEKAKYQKLSETLQLQNEILTLEIEEKRLEHESDIVILEEKLDSARQVELKLTKELDDQTIELNDYKAIVDTLKHWHVEQAEQLADKVESLNELQECFTELEKQHNLTKHKFESQHHEMTTLEEMNFTNEELITQLIQVEECLQNRVNEVKYFRAALNEVTSKLSNVEKQKNEKISELEKSIESMSEELSLARHYLKPMWKRHAEEFEQQCGSIPSYKMLKRRAEFNCVMYKNKINFLSSCFPPKLWKNGEEQIEQVMQFHRIVGQSGLFIQYLIESKLKESVESAKQNINAVSKEGAFCRWIQNVIVSLSQLVALISQVSVKIQTMDADTFTHYTTKSSNEGTTLINKIDQLLGVLISSAASDRTSSLIDTEPFVNMVSELESFIVNSTPGLSAVYSSDNQDGVLLSYVVSCVYRVHSLAAFNICELPIYENAKEAIDKEIWLSFYDITQECIDQILQYVEVPTCLDLFMKPFIIVTRNPQSLVESITESIVTLERVFCLENELSVHDIKQEQQEQAKVLLSNLRLIEDSMKTNTIMPPTRVNNAPWDTIATKSVENLTNVTHLENLIVDLHEREGKLKTTVMTLEKELNETNETSNTWKKKSIETSIQIEKMAADIAKNEILQVQEDEYKQSILQTRSELNSAQSVAANFKKQLSDTVKQLNDTRKSLQKVRSHMTHARQSDWDAMEITHLKNIVQKLQRELYALQMDNAERDLYMPDLQSFLHKNLTHELESSFYPTCPKSLELDSTDSTEDEDKQSPIDDLYSELFAPDLKQQLLLHASLKRDINIVEEMDQLQSSMWRNATELPQLLVSSLMKGEKINDSMLSNLKSSQAALQLRLDSVRLKAEHSIVSKLATEESPTFKPFLTRPMNQYFDHISDNRVENQNLKPVARLHISDVGAKRTEVQKVFASPHQLRSLYMKMIGVV